MASRVRVRLAVVAAMLVWPTPSVLPIVGQDPERERFSAFAVKMGTTFGLPGSGQSGQVQITIERRSTPAERQTLASTRSVDNGRPQSTRTSARPCSRQR